MIFVDFCKFPRFRESSIEPSNWMGLMVSGSILLTWWLSLLGLLPLDLGVCAPIELILLILLRMFLHTGLFVIAHDAMHGNVLPSYPVENRWLSQLGLWGCMAFCLIKPLVACTGGIMHIRHKQEILIFLRGKEILGLCTVRWYIYPSCFSMGLCKN